MSNNAPLSESTVLTPLDPSKDTNSDNWPDFELNNARVYLPDERDAMTSLLLASEHYPLTVIGDVQLNAIPNDSSHLIKLRNNQRTTPIEINEVRTFSYGQFDDGTVGLWAGGRAGWYRMKPARAYRETYNEMIEAIKMLYFVADAYREERKTGKGRNATVLPPYSAQELFEKYAREVMGVPKAAPRAAEKVYKHVEFLFVSMLVGKEGIDWANNPLYLHLRKKFAPEHFAIVQRPAGTPKPIQNVRQASIDSGSTTSSLKRKRGRPPKNQDTDVISLGSSSDAGSTAKTAPKAASEAPKLNSAPRTKGAASRRTRQKSSPITEPLPEEPAGPEPAATPILEISDSEEEPAGRARKGKSALRLKPSKGAKGKKGASHSGKAPVTEDDVSEDELGSSPSAPKRALPDAAESRPSRRRNSKPEVDEGIDMPESPPISEPPDDPETPDAEAGAPAELLTHEDAVRLKHAPDPIQEDTWLCALDGCTHKVYLASQPESQRLIREHYALHAYDDDERVKMVKKLQAPSLPVERLMEKVRLQARVEGFPGSRVGGSRFPEPIAQRL